MNLFVYFYTSTFYKDNISNSQLVVYEKDWFRQSFYYLIILLLHKLDKLIVAGILSEVIMSY